MLKIYILKLNECMYRSKCDLYGNKLTFLITKGNIYFTYVLYAARGCLYRFIKAERKTFFCDEKFVFDTT